ncbi:hypothetical protein Lser_V15G20419 [Lactuca serriola]
MLKNDTSTLCDICRFSPTTIFCRADLAYLCATCDAVIHSANPLAGRHHRVPVIPISGLIDEHQTSDARSITGVGADHGGFLSQESKDAIDNEDEENEAASWLQFGNENQNGEMNGCLFNGDDYLELVEYNSCQDSLFSDDHNIRQYTYGGGDGDSIVPVQSGETKKHLHGFQHPKLELAMEYEASNGGYGYTCVQIPAPIDRKARVLRYMEKKKRRKFEKRIRYESRKAYAEIRPRIKGRFAKRTNVGVKVEQIFSTNLATEGGHCIVPSFTM